MSTSALVSRVSAAQRDVLRAFVLALAAVFTALTSCASTSTATRDLVVLESTKFT